MLLLAFHTWDQWHGHASSTEILIVDVPEELVVRLAQMHLYNKKTIIVSIFWWNKSVPCNESYFSRDFFQEGSQKCHN